MRKLVANTPPILDACTLASRRAQRKGYFTKLLEQCRRVREEHCRSVLNEFRILCNRQCSFRLPHLPGSSSIKHVSVMEKVPLWDSMDVPLDVDVYVAVVNGDTYYWKRCGEVHQLSNTDGTYTMFVANKTVFTDGHAGDSYNYSSNCSNFTIRLGGGEETSLAALGTFPTAFTAAPTSATDSRFSPGPPKDSEGGGSLAGSSLILLLVLTVPVCCCCVPTRKAVKKICLDRRKKKAAAKELEEHMSQQDVLDIERGEMGAVTPTNVIHVSNRCLPSLILPGLILSSSSLPLNAFRLGEEMERDNPPSLH